MLQVRHQNPFQCCPLENPKAQLVVLSLALTLTQVSIGVEQPRLQVHLVRVFYLVYVMLASFIDNFCLPSANRFRLKE